MEATHQHHDDHDHEHNQAPAAPVAAPSRANRPREDWHDEEFVGYWINEQDGRISERHRQFVVIRALIPKATDQEFRYLNVGAGAGHLDEVLLEHFKGATATLADISLAMLESARQRLARFGDRVEYVQADFSTPAWAGALSGPFDVAVSSIAIHNLRDAPRIRGLYAETCALLGHGGVFLNLDYVRPPRVELTALAPWAGKDPEAGLSPRSGGNNMPGTMVEQMGWLSEAGFGAVDAFWKDMNVVCFGGIKDHLHLPDAAHDHDHAAEGNAHPH